MSLHVVDEGSQSSIAGMIPDLFVNEGKLPAVPRSATLSSRRPAPVVIPMARANEHFIIHANTKARSASPNLHPSLPAVPSTVSHSRGSRSPLSSRSPASPRPCSVRSGQEESSVSPRLDRDDMSVSKSSSRSPRSSFSLAEEIHTIKHRRGTEPLIPLNPLRSFRRIEGAQSQYPQRVSRDSANSQCQSSRMASKESTSSKHMSSGRVSTTASANSQGQSSRMVSKESTSSKHMSSQRVSTTASANSQGQSSRMVSKESTSSTLMSSRRVSNTADAPPLSAQDTSDFDKELEEHICRMASSSAEESARTLGYVAGNAHLTSSLHGPEVKRFDAQLERQRAGDEYRQQILDSVEDATIEESLAQSRGISKRASAATIAFCVSQLESKLSRARHRVSFGVQDPVAQDQEAEWATDVMPLQA